MPDREPCRRDWIRTTSEDSERRGGSRQWSRQLHGCTIWAVLPHGEPGSGSPADTAYRHIEWGCCDTLTARWHPPAGVDPDAWSDAVAELLAGFAASLPTRAVAMLAQTDSLFDATGQGRC